MQRTSDLHSSIISTEDCFDMWRDYMNLSGLMLRLCAVRDEETQEHQEPKKKQPGPRGRSRGRLRGSAQSSPGTSCASSPSDSSCSRGASDFCRFCKQNGETPSVFRSHRLKTDQGKVICPILCSFTCPICGATGDSAHTRRYCPKAQRQQTGIKL
ncbi:nanos homolog 2 [Gouania willdenowi]|uniref:nanos homolog 2 n=1 Tax=Gouania willdenowi TaxID=441366 RepID=UPI0010564F2E|nr:nanos homolog 2-like [Gouania willdenowi]